MDPTPAEELFDMCLIGVVEDTLIEQDVLAVLGSMVKNQKREPNEDGRVFLTIGGTFFRATMIFRAKTKTLYHVSIEVGEQAFVEMRAYARAKQMQAMADPTEGVKVEWNKGLLGAKHELILKQFVGRPMEVAASFIKLFGQRTVFFQQRELT